MRNLFVLLSASMLSACVSNKSVQTVQVGDSDKSCELLRSELSQLGAKFEEVKDDSGVTGKNVGLAIFFWPGIIVNEVRSNKNEDSVDARIAHLTSIYNTKCIGSEEDSGSETLKGKLIELKSMLDDGLISQEEYDFAKKKALENN